MKLTERQLGIAYGIGAFGLWGTFPLYWKAVNNITAYEILAHRIFWSCLFMFALLIVFGKAKSSWQEIRILFKEPRNVLWVSLASVLISINWCTYIWAVNDGRIIETSLGYYINPLVNVLLGCFVLKESLSGVQKFAVGLAGFGVAIMIWQAGMIPWVSLTLAFSFGIYGLIKKLVKMNPLTSITIETLLVTPFAMYYLYYLASVEQAGWTNMDAITTVLILCSGMITAIPLILFSAGAKYLPLNVLGFLQYLSPTIALLLGIFVFGEIFTINHLYSFGLIWIALGIFSICETKFFIKLVSKL